MPHILHNPSLILCGLMQLGILGTLLISGCVLLIDAKVRGGEWVVGGLDGDLVRGGTTSTYNSCWSKSGSYCWC